MDVVNVSGRQIYKGNSIDLAIGPITRKKQRSRAVGFERFPPLMASCKRLPISSNPRLPVFQNKPRPPISNPMSPIRSTKKTFLAVLDNPLGSYQNPVSRYEDMPTNTQKIYNSRMFGLSTRPNKAPIKKPK